jgi:F-type H+-transporting ATPase subunit delta
MTESKVARRYANSLLTLAVERNIMDRINEDMLLIARTCAQNKELSQLLKNPIINSDKKESILNALFGSKVDAVTKTFVQLLARKGREADLEAIAAAFNLMYKNVKGIKTAYVTTAVAMDDSLRGEVMNLLKRSRGEQVELIEKVDPSIIGGFVLRIGDVQYDASISKKLKALKSEFDDNLYIKGF